jgi:serine/threonine protein kinase
VKRCKQIDKSRTEEFVQELVILCRVNHPNIVKLLGCCLHFEAPMLVYEFVQNGTLNDLLHGKRRRHVTLATRLMITAEAAEALAHLHSPPHTTLHGDKPENILLREDWVAKVTDFGCSTLDDNVQVVPKGTLAYRDPEFLQDFQIADKTDV